MIQFFDRHDVLNDEMLDYHAETMQMIDKIRYFPNKRPMTDYEKSSWKELYKYLNAIYDGVLYPDLAQKWYIDSAPFYTIRDYYYNEGGQKIALRIHAIIGIIYCSQPSLSPVTSHQEMILSMMIKGVDSPSDKIQVI